MGNRMRLFVILCLLTQSGLLFAAEKKVILSVTGMTCRVCPVTVKKSLQKVAGVKSVTVSYENKTAAVVFDDQLTNTERLLKATENAGYPSTVLKKTP